MLFRVYVLDKPDLPEAVDFKPSVLDVTGLRDAKHPVAHSRPGPTAGTGQPLANFRKFTNQAHCHTLAVFAF